MIGIKVTDEYILNQGVDCFVFMCAEGFLADKKNYAQAFKDLFKKMPHIPELFKKQNFTGKALTSSVVSTTIDEKLIHCIFIGLGKPGSKNTIDIENYR